MRLRPVAIAPAPAQLSLGDCSCLYPCPFPSPFALRSFAPKGRGEAHICSPSTIRNVLSSWGGSMGLASSMSGPYWIVCTILSLSGYPVTMWARMRGDDHHRQVRMGLTQSCEELRCVHVGQRGRRGAGPEHYTLPGHPKFSQSRSFRLLRVCGETNGAFGRRCIPSRFVPQPQRTDSMPAAARLARAAHQQPRCDLFVSPQTLSSVEHLSDTTVSDGF